MSNGHNTGGPAFPEHKFTPSHGGGGHWTIQGGMTLRDWFAGQAVAGRASRVVPRPEKDENVAAWAYRIADAMIAERGK